MILVIGGRSKIGAALVDRLVEAGEQVRLLVRGGEASDGSGRPGVRAARALCGGKHVHERLRQQHRPMC